MKQPLPFYHILLGSVLTLNLSIANAENPSATIDTAKIEQITGLKGKLNKDENVFKISKPRTDIKVEVDKWQMPPFMGLTSWAAFTPAQNGQTMIMGDTVVFEDEVNPAMSAAFESGLEVTALHNHFFFDKPKVYFMHIGGMGSESELAQGVRNVYDKIAEIRAAHPQPASRFLKSIPHKNSITSEPLESILGVKGTSKDGMFKVSIGQSATMHGTEFGKGMGLNTWAAFAGSDDQAVVDGDFAMLENEMQAVLKTMRQGGINIVAIHNHMTGEKPHYYFMHYWGKGKAADLARTIRSALDAQAKSNNQ
jgi:hypothetical protein